MTSNTLTDTPDVVGLQIIKIKTISFRIDEQQILKQEPNKPIKIELQHRVGYHVEASLLFLINRCYTHYEDETLKDSFLTDIEVENVFMVHNLANFMNNGEDSLPQTVWTAIIALSIGHARAMLAERVAGTLLANVIIPIVDPVEVTRAFLSHRPNS